MADEELVPDGDEALELAPEERQEEPQTPDPIANLAAELGWTPKEQWQGDPEKWKPADQFIRDGRDIQQTTTRELRSLREQMERLGSVQAQIVQDKVAERDAYWQAKFDEAVEAGDTAEARKIAQQMGQVHAPATDPSVEAWKAKNTWFSTNPLAQAVAVQAAEQVKHLPVSQQLEMAERAVKRDFPELFQTQAPAKQPPATQTAATRSAAPSNRQKGFAEMPRESQQAALEMERLNGVPKESYAKHYWANLAKKGSVA